MNKSLSYENLTHTKTNSEKNANDNIFQGVGVSDWNITLQRTAARENSMTKKTKLIN